MGECAPAAAAAAPTTAKTSVWWDIDKCAVPRGRCDPHRIAHNLIAALAAAGYAGPVSIAAYGDAARVPPPVLAALSATGICLHHVPAGSKDTSEKRMLVDMLFWAFDNPPPGNYLLISGDQDLSDLLHRLRMKRYDILLVRPPNASSQALAAAAKKIWLWENLTAGELLLPEPAPARSVLGCKLNVNSSDTLKCSQSKVCSEYGKGDSNGNAGNQNRVKPLQKYVKKASSSSTPASTQDRVAPAGGVSGSYIGSTSSEIDHSSASSLSSSSSDSLECAKVATSVPLETPTLSKLSSQKSVFSTHSQQVEATHRSVPGEKPSTSSERVPRNATLDLGASNGHYNGTSQHLRYSEAQNKLHSEFTTGGNKGKAVNRPGVKPLQKYVKKTNATFGSANKQVGSVGVHERPIGNKYQQSESSEAQNKLPCYSNMGDSTGKLGNEHKLNVSSASASNEINPSNGLLDNSKRSFLSYPSQSLSAISSSKSLESAKVNDSSPLLFAHRSLMTEHLDQDGAASAFGNKTSTSFQCTAKNEAFVFGVSSGQYHPTYQQAQSSLLSEQHNSGTAETRPPFQGAPTNDPSMGMPDISGHSTGFHESRSSFYFGSNTSSYLNHSSDPHSSHSPCSDTCRDKPGYPPNSPKNEGTIGIILHALGILKTEKIFPTESNIADCICYGDINLTSFDVKKALELAIRHEAVVMKKLLHDMPLFVAKDESLWKCVDVTNSKAKNLIEELEMVHKYISTSGGYSGIKNSQSRMQLYTCFSFAGRYQAAMILKRSCLQHCALSNILQVLHIIIVRKKWIVPHSSGWQPLSINTTADIATTDATGKVKS
ncbi:uncharacterized protein C2845_PM02G25090 [Panicum miliaceum]|uniref:Uncharacterized protein n=1 Tax=Panicum miliaceum TaxID=4540 RepID=A0A3L6SFS9_PANMI|nr:uncharacterized protein C2845_PM02G25090 [Panicum miliaceum]